MIEVWSEPAETFHWVKQVQTFVVAGRHDLTPVILMRSWCFISYRDS